MNSKPRILHLFNAFRIGGVERQHLTLVKALRSEFDQVCWAINHGPAEDRLDELGIPHCCGHFDIIKTLLEQSHFDCIVMRTHRPLFAMADYLKECPVPIVYTRNYLRWSGDEETYFNPEWERVGVDVADYCLFSGPMLRDPVLELVGDVPGGELIYNGLELGKYPLKPKSPPASGKPLRAGMLGTIIRRKNQLEVIRVLRETLSTGDLELCIAGSPYNEEDYGRKVAEAAQGLPVRLPGHTDDPVRFFEDIDVLLSASTLEGWPNVFMEAFACGVPVITPDVGDVRELFGPEHPGYIYPRGECERIPGLLDAIRRPGEYSTLSAKAVARARTFDVNTAAALLVHAVKTVMAEKDSRHAP